MANKKATRSRKRPSKGECFVIMPISDQPGYPDGHFGDVYRDLIKPAVKTSGYTPVRADEVKKTNLIHEDILRRLLDTPLAVCDLSSRNPNVLFELGIRQAFDKPTVLLKDDKTPEVFDVGPLRYIEYAHSLRYADVLEAQAELDQVIGETIEAAESGELVNSLIRLLALQEAATKPDAPTMDAATLVELVRAEIRSELRAHQGPKLPSRQKRGRAVLIDRATRLTQLALAISRTEGRSEVRQYIEEADEAIRLAKSVESDSARVRELDRTLQQARDVERARFSPV
ncbi:MAG: hypothetical protein AAFV43_00235 [Planctomycetota bacterium]